MPGRPRPAIIPQLTVISTLLLTLLTQVRCAGNQGCSNVPVREGMVHMRNFDNVCAPLAADQEEAEYGTSYLVCFNGEITTMNCPSSLRFDTESKRCGWYHKTSCALPIGMTLTSVHVTQRPTMRPTTQRPTARPTQRPTRNPYWPWTYTPRPITQRPTYKPITQRPTYKPITQRPTTQRPYTQRPHTYKPYTQRPPFTQKPGKPSGPCNRDTCKSPNCFCYDEAPRHVPKSSTPQFIMVTFDDAVTALMYQRFYLPLLVENKQRLFNPSGCPGRAAFYVSHNYTEYELVKKLYKAGHEIASHTINHRLPDGDKLSDLAGMRAEIQGLKDMMLKWTKMPELVNSIRGFRAPFLRVAHDVQFQELVQDGFEYDSSITNARLQSNLKPIWPYTLDFLVPKPDCINPPCPTKPFPGLFEIPLNSWMGDNGYPCSMVDECWVGANANTASQEEWYTLFKRNFENNFYPDKTPMPFFMHASLFMRNANAYRALGQFIRDILTKHDDVWMVTPRQVIQWMRDQKSSSDMADQKWDCSS